MQNGIAAIYLLRCGNNIQSIKIIINPIWPPAARSMKTITNRQRIRTRSPTEVYLDAAASADKVNKQISK